MVCQKCDRNILSSSDYQQSVGHILADNRFKTVTLTDTLPVTLTSTINYVESMCNKQEYFSVEVSFGYFDRLL